MSHFPQTVENSTARAVIFERLKARQDRERRQGQLLTDDDLFHETIRTKLQGIFETNQFHNFSKCGKEEFYRTCEDCRSIETFTYRCNLKWCPRCAWRIAAKRKDLIAHWAKKITQPKHLVLTQKNFPILTGRKIRQFSKCLAALRRRKICRTIRGGCASIEITNENRGWHLHAHLLLDVRWIDIKKLAVIWGKIVGQEFAIVKILDVREKDYLREVCKYVVEGSELAKWQPDELNEFVRAIKSRRFFFSFGSLRELAPEIRREIHAAKPPRPVCDCGCSKFIYESEEQAIIHEIKFGKRQT